MYRQPAFQVLFPVQANILLFISMAVTILDLSLILVLAFFALGRPCLPANLM